MWFPPLNPPEIVDRRIWLTCRLLGVGAVQCGDNYYVGFVLTCNDGKRYMLTADESDEFGQAATALRIISIEGCAFSVPDVPLRDEQLAIDPRQGSLPLLDAPAPIVESSDMGEPAPAREWDLTKPLPVDADLL